MSNSNLVPPQKRVRVVRVVRVVPTIPIVAVVAVENDAYLLTLLYEASTYLDTVDNLGGVGVCLVKALHDYLDHHGVNQEEEEEEEDQAEEDTNSDELSEHSSDRDFIATDGEEGEEEPYVSDDSNGEEDWKSGEETSEEEWHVGDE
jgi:hypothetical protein